MSHAGSQDSRVGPQIIFGMDTRGRCTMSIGHGLEGLGLRGSELVGQDLLEVYRDTPVVLAALRRALRGETFTLSQEAGGRLLWTYFQAVHDQSGEFTGVVGVTTDMTDQRRDESDARAARERATTLADLSVQLGRTVDDPVEVLRIGVRLATEALAEIGVIWLLSESGAAVEPRAAWHSEAAVRERLDAAVVEVRGWAGWLDAASVGALEEPLLFDLTAVAATGLTGSAPVRSLVVELGLRHGLRIPVRSRGEPIGFLDVAGGEAAGPFTEDDIVFGLDIADRFTLAYDNALLLAEQQEALEELFKFQSLADASGDLIAIADERGRPVYVNPRVEAVGMDLGLETLWDIVGRYAGESTVSAMRTALDAGGRWAGDVELTVGGELTVVETEVFPLAHPRSGEPNGSAWIGKDVTALRRTERALRSAVADLTRFQALVEASSDFIAIADLDGRVRYLNPAGRTMIGLDPDADVSDTTTADYLTPEARELSERVEQPAVQGLGHWEGESTLRHLRGGPPVPVAIASFMLYDDTGEPFGLATVQRDISEHRAADLAVRELAEQRQALLSRLVSAQEAERAQIAGDVHDDPVQALAAVDLRLGLLERRLREEAPQLLDILGPVQESVARANDRLRALLFDLEAPDLDRGLRPALERAAAEVFKDTGVEAVVVAEEEPPASASTRAVAYRIAREALINVRKHAGARTVTVTVTGRDSGLSVEVVDDGHGVGRAPTASQPGHHGLSSMRDRATLGGGRWSISNRPGGGTVVAFWLPDAASGTT